MYAKRDWGHAKDYVDAMWRIFQQKKPNDYVIATGKQYTVKEFVQLAANILKIKILWKGNGTRERGYNENGRPIIQISKKYFRPLEVDTLLGNSSKAKKMLKWKPKIDIKTLIKEMIDFEIKNLR